MFISPISMYSAYNNVSFGATQNGRPSSGSTQHHRDFDDTIRFTPIRDDEADFHTKENSTRQTTAQSKEGHHQTRAAKKAQKRRTRKVALGLAATIAAGTAIGVAVAPPENTAIVVHVDHYENVGGLADIYGIPVEILEAYNHVSADETGTTIAIPDEFDYVQDEIDKLQIKLFDKDLDAEKRNEYEAQIATLLNKQKQQKETALMYTDGEYVYIKAKKSIGVTQLKELFDIKDGKIRKHNDIDYTWDYDERIDEHFKNYDTATIAEGAVIKLRPNDIKH